MLNKSRFVTRRVAAAPVCPELCPTRMMLFENRFACFRSVRLLVLGCCVPLLPMSAQAQTSSSSSSQTPSNAAPGTAPIPTRAAVQQINPTRVATYDEKFEIYGGLSFMNGQAGQNLPKRYNMGGGEAMGTYWLGSKLGVAGDYRFEAGTTDLIPTSQLPNTRATVYQNIIAGGVNYRGPKGRYAAIDFHALAGAAHGQYDHSLKNDANIPAGTPPSNFGLYNNSTTPWGAAGGSIDFNAAPKWAVRISPDMIFEHYGTELREFVSVSLGVVYRFGKR